MRQGYRRQSGDRFLHRYFRYCRAPVAGSSASTKVPRATRLVLGLTVLFALLWAGCGKREDPQTPIACREGTEAMLTALAEAPGPVQLGDGSTRISDCLVRAQEAGPLAEVGQAMIGAATELNAEARREPGSQANLALGYLLGAAQTAATETSGIHTDLIRRLEAAATSSAGGRDLPPQFEAALERGQAAGRERG